MPCENARPHQKVEIAGACCDKSRPFSSFGGKRCSANSSYSLDQAFRRDNDVSSKWFPCYKCQPFVAIMPRRRREAIAESPTINSSAHRICPDSGPCRHDDDYLPGTRLHSPTRSVRRWPYTKSSNSTEPAADPLSSRSIQSFLPVRNTVDHEVHEVMKRSSITVLLLACACVGQQTSAAEPAQPPRSLEFRTISLNGEKGGMLAVVDGQPSLGILDHDALLWP